MKICKLCGIEKPLTEYSKRINYGYMSYCKPCASKYTAALNKKRNDAKRELNRKKKLKDVFYIDNLHLGELSQNGKSETLLAEGYITHRLWR